MWCVQRRGKQPFDYDETITDDYNHAVSLCEKWRKERGDYCRIIEYMPSPPKPKTEYVFPLNVRHDLPIIVNSRYHLSNGTKHFNQMLGKIADERNKK